MTYESLFTPGQIGGIPLKNRVVMVPMGTRYAEPDGTFGKRNLAYYLERAKAGVGLIIIGGAMVARDATPGGGPYFCNRDEQLPGLTELAAGLHAAGAKTAMQLNHPGARAISGKPIPTPSGIPAFAGQKAYAMSLKELHNLQEDFAAAALRAKQAGFDGVEFHAAHNYMLHNFLSPHFNHRDDAYGGSPENRMRFLVELLEQARALVDPDYPLWVRLSADEYLPDGQGVEEFLLVCKKMEELGMSAIDVSIGGASNGRSHTIEPMSYPEGWRKHYAKLVKKTVSIPVITTTVIRHPAFAEKLLEEGYTDFVGLGRPLLADPDWLKKTAEGRFQDIRHCISCCRCIESLAAGPVICSVNAELGQEMEAPIQKDSVGKNALVVGGGPAGMEAARVLALRGFSVNLYERSSRLGGQMALAGAVPYKDKMNWYIDWQKRQLEGLNVGVWLNTAITSDDLATQHVDLIVDATGGEPVKPASIPGLDLPLVHTPVEVLSGAYAPKDSFLAVIGSGLTGLETAEVLAEAGNMVHVFEMADTIAPGGSPINTGEALRRLNLQNVPVRTRRQLVAVGEDRILLRNPVSQQEYLLPVDGVILSLGVRGTSTIQKDLSGTCPIVTVGDADTPGRIYEAVLAGYQAARNA